MRPPIEAAARVASADWPLLLAALDERGYAVLPGVLDPAECGDIAALYDDEACFRSRVVMARHNFGRGEYRYLRYPLPSLVAALREALYPRLAALANRWHKRLGLEPRFPVTLGAYLDRCHAAGQQRPRMQSKGEVVPLRQGDAVIFAVNHRPLAGTRGFYRVMMRHGVSRLHSGHRFTLGIIFHDAA